MWQELLSRPLRRTRTTASARADLSKVTVPLLSAANWGGQGLHTRGNFEGFTGAASKQKWLEVHGGSHWAPFYTDYGVEAAEALLRSFPQRARTTAGTGSRACCCRCVIPARNSSRATRTNGRSRARSGRTSTSTPTACGFRRRRRRPSGAIAYDAMGDGMTFSTPPLERETEITGPSALKLFISSSTADADIFAVLRVFDPKGKEVLFQGALDPHTPVGQGWLRASQRKLDPKRSLPYRPFHTHDEKQPLEPGEDLRARRRDLADLHRRSGGLPHRAHDPRPATTSTRARRRRSPT